MSETQYQVMPELTEEEYTELKNDIAQRGVMIPIEYDEAGHVLDGHHRLKACGELGIKDFPKVIRAGMTESEKLIHARRLNLARRHLTGDQKQKLIRDQLKATPELSDRQIAKGLGVSHPTVSVQRKAMEENGDVEKFTTSIDTLGREQPRKHKPVTVFNPTKKEEAAMKNPEVVERMRGHDGKSIQQVCNAMKKEEVKRRAEEYAAVQTGVVDIASTDKKYNIIYADPAWRYWERGNKNQELHYPTMSLEDICALPVKNIADDNCALFLWITYPILPDAFKVIEAWGFEYSTAAFVWVKRNKHNDKPFFGCGSWTRANSELCLLATRGHVERLDAGISQVIESPVEEHSKKPDITRTLITRLLGELPRIELFARTAAEGWDVWGNEA